MQANYISDVSRYATYAGLEFSAAFATGYLIARNQGYKFEDIQTQPPVTQCVYDIVSNNIRVGAMGIAVPIWIAGYNGFSLGYTYYILSTYWGHLKVLKALLPHGIIEIPTLLMFCGIGFKIEMDIWHTLTGHKVDWQNSLLGLLEISFYLSLLFVVAAFIEIYFSKEDKIWEGKIPIYQGCLIK